MGDGLAEAADVETEGEEFKGPDSDDCGEKEENEGRSPVLGELPIPLLRLAESW